MFYLGYESDKYFWENDNCSLDFDLTVYLSLDVTVYLGLDVTVYEVVPVLFTYP